MRSAAMLCVSDCVHDGIRPGVPQATEWQRIGNQINAALVAARAHFVNACCVHRIKFVHRAGGVDAHLQCRDGRAEPAAALMEVLQRRLERDYPQVLLLPGWEAFVL